MKQSQIISTYRTIQDMEDKNKEYPLTVSHAIFVIKRALQDQWDFQTEEERKLFQKYRPKADDNGMLQFKDDAEANEWVEKIKELGNMDVELDYVKPTIKLNDNVGLTVKEVEALYDFVNFIE